MLYALLVSFLVSQVVPLFLVCVWFDSSLLAVRRTFKALLICQISRGYC